MTIEPILDVSGVSKQFQGSGGICALNLRIGVGEVMGLVGANGAGKSTSLRVIVGLCEPERGSVRILGSDVYQSPLKAKEHLGYVPDGHDLPEMATCAEYFELLGAFRGLSRQESRERSHALLRLMDAENYFNKLTGSLSHGTRKKVQIAGALLAKPRLLVMDEPTSGLDVESRAIFKELIANLKARGASILLATHNLDLAQTLCDSVTILAKSCCTFSGQLHTFLEHHGRLEDRIMEMTRGADWKHEVTASLDDLAI